MPLIRIDMPEGEKKEFLQLFMNTLMDAVVSVLRLPENDRNIRLNEYKTDLFRMKPPYRYIIEITLFSGRTVETKRKLYQTIAESLAAKTGIDINSIFIVLNEQPMENWGVRGGKAACDIDPGFNVKI